MAKLLAYHWSAHQSIEWLRDQVDASLENAGSPRAGRPRGVPAGYLDDYWGNAKLELDGDPELSAPCASRSSSSCRPPRAPTAARSPRKGLTGPGYDGHAFWDTEGYVLPVLAYSQPRLARDALRWRHSTLDMARERARQLGLRGALFPWRTIRGEECSSYWPAGTAAPTSTPTSRAPSSSTWT